MIAVGMAAGVAVWGQDRAEAVPPEPGGKGVIEWDREVRVDRSSHAVKWREWDYELVRFGLVKFHREGAHLTARLRGGITTFDDVTYDVSCAVRDAEGRLLGVARVEVEVQRMWLGKTMAMGLELELDFGESLDYERAAGFELAISRERVLTPDEWQE